MSSKAGNVIVAQGGGPTAVINNSLCGVVSQMTQEIRPNAKIWGARFGAEGLINEDFIDLRDVSNQTWKKIGTSAAAALGSCRKKLSKEDTELIVKYLRKRDVRYFFYIGGNDSMDTAMKIAASAGDNGYELCAVGVPKTIDNDLPETDHCPGYGSASRYFAQSTIDLGADIRSLPTPVSIMEVMGRNSGWLTAATMLAKREEDDAPHLVYVPEIPFNRQRFLTDVESTLSRYGWLVATVSEGLVDESGNSIGSKAEEAAIDGFGHPQQGEVAAALAGIVTRELGIRARSEKPGLCGRASSILVSPVDRSEAYEIGKFAADQALLGKSSFMAAIHREPGNSYRVSFRMVPLSLVANVERLLPRDYLNKKKNGIADHFKDYVEPLIGASLQCHERLF